VVDGTVDVTFSREVDETPRSVLSEKLGDQLLVRDVSMNKDVALVAPYGG
jgi:hypothetical protein